VLDTGPGLPADVLPRIFDPFFTTKAPGEGSGLGLSVAHGIATEHRGRLWAENCPAGGAAFFLDLPIER
jgi:signal transduction histidine kinase